ncbi:hypothetical protein LJR175_001015 [Variovorax sp. LjRoot175]|uniref:hypothetical protein n=1 Tax=Variovorax sp. LjRoot175 TaxID=3342276 RepID=UPI003ECFAAFA
MPLTYTEAFAKYGAKLHNTNWSVSAFGSDGSLVVSLYETLIKPASEKGTLVYVDTLSHWQGNEPGRREFERHLHAVVASRLPIKVVIAHPTSEQDAALVGNVADESKIKKTFSVREDFVGSLADFDGDTLRIVFRRVV